MNRKPTAALVLVFIILAATQANAQADSPHLTQREARSVTKQALTYVAALIDADGVKVRSCELNGDRARCQALVRGPRQTLTASVAVRELQHDYVVRVLHIH